MFLVTDCSLLSLDSSCQAASLVGECGRPAALVCVYTLETTPSFRPTPGPMPRCCLPCTDQWDGPTQPGVDDSCVTIGLRGGYTWGRLYLFLVLRFGFFFFFTSPSLSFFFFLKNCFPKTFHSLMTRCYHRGLASIMKLGCKINKCILLDLNMFIPAWGSELVQENTVVFAI